MYVEAVENRPGPKVLLLENIDPEAEKLFEAHGYHVDSCPDCLDQKTLRERIHDDNVDIVGFRARTQMTGDFLNTLRDTNLCAMGTYTVGTEHDDWQTAVKIGVAGFNDPISSTRSVAEWAVWAIIGASRGLDEKNMQTHRGEWRKSAKDAHVVLDKTLGIIGHGNIGSQLSVLAAALGMNVIFHDLGDTVLRFGKAVQKNSMEAVLREADIVTVHVDGRPENRNLFTAKEFKMMKPGSIFINASRGSVVVEEDLADSLKSGHLRGAVIDVFQNEPLANGDTFTSSLTDIPSATLTPHVAGSTTEAQQDIARYVTKKLILYHREGNTMGSVNFPQVQRPRKPDTHGLASLHDNVPGALAEITTILRDNGINITGTSPLETTREVGYVILEVNQPLEEPIIREINAVPHTIRTRVLY